MGDVYRHSRSLDSVLCCMSNEPTLCVRSEKVFGRPGPAFRVILNADREVIACGEKHIAIGAYQCSPDLCAGISGSLRCMLSEAQQVCARVHGQPHLL